MIHVITASLSLACAVWLLLMDGQPLAVAGMQCVLDKAAAPVNALAFGRLDSALLAFGADDGVVRVASISEQKASILHVKQPSCLSMTARKHPGSFVHSALVDVPALAVTLLSVQRNTSCTVWYRR